MEDLSINAVLKDLRRENNLTQEELAKKMGVTRDMVARMDAELQNVKFEYLVEFAKAIQMSVSAIMQRFENGPEFVYLLRAAHGSYFSDNLRMRYEKWYRSMEQVTISIPLPQIREIPKRESRFADIADDVERGECVACWLRQKWNLGTNPIDDPVNLIESLGYFIIGADLGDIELFAITGKKKGTDIPGIVINTNRNITIERQRYSVIHELGHIVEHDNQFDAVPDSHGRGRSKDLRDKFADAFAGEFLVPAEELKRLYKQFYIRNFDNKVIYLKNYFRVSYECILNRLFRCGLLNMDKKAFGAFLGKKRAFFNKKEPFPMKTPLSFNQENQLKDMIQREKKYSEPEQNPPVSSMRISYANP